MIAVASSFLTWISFVAQLEADEPFPAHRIADNVYYVGSKELSTYLITSSEGHILINSSFEETVPLIQAAVESLNFKMTDVKILLASHAHSDHVAGHARLQQLTNAKVFVMEGDDRVIANGGEGQYLYTDSRWAKCSVDRVLKDGDEVKLGGTTLVARRTPGHTRGCTTWTWKTTDAGKTVDVVVIGSPNVNPGFKLVANREYPEIANDYARTFKTLKSLPCDVFLGAHGNYYGMLAKYDRLQTNKGQNPFIDPAGYRAYVELKEQAFRKNLADQQGPLAARLQQFVDDQTVAGAVGLVAQNGKVIQLASLGQADLAAQTATQDDTIYWIASMTKLITSAAVFIAQDEGKLTLDDPVSKHLPEFATVALADGNKPQRAITIRDLMSHTSGVANPASEKLAPNATLADVVNSIAQQPLQFEPGSQWKYGSGLTVAGRIVEVVANQPFEKFVDQRICQPLGMRDTTYYPTPEQRRRLAKVYRYDREAKLLEAAKIPANSDSAGVRRAPGPSGGMCSTAQDYYRFLQMVLNGGKLDGQQILSATAVKQMTSSCIGDLSTGSWPGLTWSPGWAVVQKPTGITEKLSPGSHGHGGAFGTIGFIDPAKQAIVVLMIARSDMSNTQESAIRAAFVNAAIDALGKLPSP